MTVEVCVAALFTVEDRCDRCAARATTRVALWTGDDLAFCDYHLHRHRGALVPLAVRFERNLELDDVFAHTPA